MRILSIETSLRQGSIAALTAGPPGIEVVDQLALPAEERSARTLLPTIAEVLKECRWKVADVELICVTTGPGSFTGLRIGVTAAKTLAFAIGAKLVGVHTLAVLAAQTLNRDGPVWAIMDAQRHELFATMFEHSGTLDVPSTRIITIDDWLAELKPGHQVIGPPLAQLSDRLPAMVKAADQTQWHPQASTVGRLGYEMFAAGRAVDPMQLVPNYYRKSAAEEKASQVS